jgi:hypothetical protein
MTQTSSSFSYLWPQFLYTIPIIFVAIAAVIVCVMNWQKAPTAAMFCLIGFGLISFNSILGPIVTTFMIRSGGSPGAMGQFLSVIGIVRVIFSVAGYVFLLIAVFTGRHAETKPSPFAAPPNAPPNH